MTTNFMPNNFGWTPADDAFFTKINPLAAQEAWEEYFQKDIFCGQDYSNSFMPQPQDPIWDDVEDICDHLFAICEMEDDASGCYDREDDDFYDYFASEDLKPDYFESLYQEAVLSEMRQWEEDQESFNYLDSECYFRALIRHRNRNLKKAA